MALYERRGKGGNVDWAKVAVEMGMSRTYHQCKQRWNTTLKPKLTGDLHTGPWSPEEVNTLSLMHSIFTCLHPANTVTYI